MSSPYSQEDKRPRGKSMAWVGLSVGYANADVSYPPRAVIFPTPAVHHDVPTLNAVVCIVGRAELGVPVV